MKYTGVRVFSNGSNWVAQWCDRNGKHHKVHLGQKHAMSRRQAQVAAKDIERQHHLNPATTSRAKAPMLSAWCDELIATKEATGASDGTIVNYQTARDKLIGFFGDIPIDRIDRAWAAKYRPWLSEQVFRTEHRQWTLSENSVRKHIVLARSLFAEAMRSDYIPFNPFDRERQVKYVLSDSFPRVTPEQVRAIMEHLSPYQRTAVMLARYAALRRNEIDRLEWSWIDMDRRVIDIQPRDGRITTKQRPRTVPIVPLLRAYLSTLTREDERVCQLPNNVERDLRRAITRAGLDPWPKPLHTLRKNCESEWLAKYPAMDVVKWCGNSIRVAASHYHGTEQVTLAAVTGKDSVEGPTQ